MSSTSSKDEIISTGEKARLLVYASTSQDLSGARVKKFQVKVATSAGIVPPEKLPPTTDAASFHSLRVYHQVQAWRGVNLPPENWGWELKRSGFYPIKLTKPAAPDQLLKIVRCSCGGKCNTKKCTCFKNRLLCTPACAQCKGMTCENGIPIDNDPEPSLPVPSCPDPYVNFI